VPRAIARAARSSAASVDPFTGRVLLRTGPPAWFDTAVAEARERRIHELEGRFRRAGLPNLIEDYSASEDVFTRALPFLGFVFLVEIANALNLDYPWWANALFVIGAFAIVVVALGLANRARGRPFLSLPRRVGRPELIAFVVVPSLLPLVFGGQWRSAIVTFAVQIVLLVLTYAVVGLGLFSILRWVAVRFFAQLGASVQVLVKSVPLLLFFSLVMFFTAEIWQAFTSPAPARFWSAIALFVLLGVGFLSVRVPSSVRSLEHVLGAGDPPLRRRARVNIAVVILVSQMLQVLFVSVAVWLFFVLLGGLLVTDDVRSSWLLIEPQELLRLPFPGGSTLVFTSELLLVSTGVAAFAGLYYTVSILVDNAHRDQFLDELTDQMRGTFADRHEYLGLLASMRSDEAGGTPGPAARPPGR
jgi:hypothetical protein